MKKIIIKGMIAAAFIGSSATANPDILVTDTSSLTDVQSMKKNAGGDRICRWIPRVCREH